MFNFDENKTGRTDKNVPYFSFMGLGIGQADAAFAS
jgi:hypothetical protein